MSIFSEGHLRSKLRQPAIKKVEEKLAVKIIYQGSYDYSKVNNLKFNALASILKTILVDQLRELTEGPCALSTTCILEKSPVTRYTISVGFYCMLSQVERLIGIADRAVCKVKDGEISEEALELFRAKELRHVELFALSNKSTASSPLYKNKTCIDFFEDYRKTLSHLKKNDLASTANLFLNKSHLKQFILLPS